MAGFTEIRYKNETMPNYVIFWMSRKVVKSRWFFLSFWCYYVHRCKKKSEIAFSKFEEAYYYRIYCNIEGGAVCKKYLTISTKSPILDVRLGSEYTCDLCLFLSKISTSWNNVLVRNIWSAIFADVESCFGFTNLLHIFNVYPIKKSRYPFSQFKSWKNVNFFLL